MSDFRQLFSGVDFTNNDKKYRLIFECLKTYLIKEVNKFIDGQKHDTRGRKRTVDLNKFFDCLFSIVDNGIKMSYINEYCGISKSTFYYYFNILKYSGLLEKIHSEIIASVKNIDYLITDSFTVKSMDGSEGVGRNPTDRGRKGIKVSLLCDQNLITHGIFLEKANVHDSKILVPTINSCPSKIKGKRCLADSGYAGHEYIRTIKRQTGIILIPKPKRTRNKFLMSHELSTQDMELLKHRNRIERLNGNIRRFRGIMIKYTKSLLSYKTYLFVAIICTTCYSLFKSI